MGSVLKEAEQIRAFVRRYNDAFPGEIPILLQEALEELEEVVKLVIATGSTIRTHKFRLLFVKLEEISLASQLLGEMNNQPDTEVVRLCTIARKLLVNVYAVHSINLLSAPCRFGGRLSKLLPKETRKGVFEPSLADLLEEYFEQLSDCKTESERKRLAFKLAVDTIGTFANCWFVLLLDKAKMYIVSIFTLRS